MKCEKQRRLLGLGMQYFTAAYRAVYHRAQDSVIQLYFCAGFWFPKSCMSDHLGHLTGGSLGLGTVGRVPLKRAEERGIMLIFTTTAEGPG